MLTTNGSSKILMMSVITIHCKEKCCKDIDVSGSILLKKLWIKVKDDACSLDGSLFVSAH